MQIRKHIALAILIVLAGACIAVAAEETTGMKINELMLAFMDSDRNKDNRVSEREYVGDRSGKNRSRARRDFRSLDDNGDGWLSRGEYFDTNTRRRAGQ
jgi:hypothetical protein